MDRLDIGLIQESTDSIDGNEHLERGLHDLGNRLQGVLDSVENVDGDIGSSWM